MKRSEEKQFTSGQHRNHLRPTRDGNESSARLPSNYSPPLQWNRGVNDNLNLSDLIDYQLTVRPKVDLTRYQMSILLELQCWLVSKNGINLERWLMIEFLWEKLLGSKKVWEIRNDNERRVCTLANMILLTSQNTWMTLGDQTELPNHLLSYLIETDLLPSDRTVRSRLDYWKLEKFLEVRAVRLDVFLEKESQTIRYSSYCKGYGESSSMGRRQKTRSSAELDGEDERPEVKLSLQDIQNLLFLNLLELRKRGSQEKA